MKIKAGKVTIKTNLFKLNNSIKQYNPSDENAQCDKVRAKSVKLACG